MAKRKSTIISESSDKPAAKQSAYYIKNPQLWEHFNKWCIELEKAKEENRDEPRMPDVIGRAFIQIATNLARKYNWNSRAYYKDEMISDAIESCIKYAKNFNPQKSNNPFSYFTQTCYTAFLRRIEKEEKQDYVKHKSMLNSLAYKSLLENGQDEDIDIEMIDYNQEGVEEFISKYEEKRFGSILDEDEIAGTGKRTRRIELQEEPSEPEGFL